MSLTLIAADQRLGGFDPVSPNLNQNLTDASGVGALTNFENMISLGLGVITVVAGVFFMLYFVLGAFKWVTAGGDSSKVGKARDEMVQGVLGLIIIVAAYGVIGLIGSIIGIDILNPAQQLLNLTPGTP